MLVVGDRVVAPVSGYQLLHVAHRVALVLSIETVGTLTFLGAAIGPDNGVIIGLFTACVGLFTSIGVAVIRSMERAHDRVSDQVDRLEKEVERKDRRIDALNAQLQYWQMKAIGLPVPPHPPENWEDGQST
jgi:hypothetical protein